MNINQILIEITKHVHMISNRKYLNKAIKNDAVTIIQHVSLMSEKNIDWILFSELGNSLRSNYVF